MGTQRRRAGWTTAWMAMRLRGRVRITTRALWVDQGRLLEQLHKVPPLAALCTALTCILFTSNDVGTQS